MTEGIVEAQDERTAVEKLKDSGLIPLRVTPPEDTMKKRYFERTGLGDVLTFTTELSALLEAGLPLDRALNVLSEITANRRMRQTVTAVLRSVREGSSFSDALGKHPSVFGRFYVSMVRAGEAGGVLEAVMSKLSEYLEASKELREHVISSLIYPAVLLITAGSSIIVLLTYVLPKFSVIFEEFDQILPLPTRILLATSDGLRTYWWAGLIAVVAVVFSFRRFVKTQEGGRRWDAFKLKVLGKIIINLETARFSRTLGTLLKSGVPLLQALDNAKDTIGNRIMAEAVDVIYEGTRTGKGVAAPMAGTGVFPELALSMVRVGEETGRLDDMLFRVAQTYDKAMRATIRRFMALFEPFMILLMGLVVVGIILSILLPIISINEMPF